MFHKAFNEIGVNLTETIIKSIQKQCAIYKRNFDHCIIREEETDNDCFEEIIWYWQISSNFPSYYKLKDIQEHVDQDKTFSEL